MGLFMLIKAACFFPVLLGAMAGLASAEPLDGKAAKGHLFDPDKVDVVFADGVDLSDKDRAILTQVLSTQPYFGAVAMSPSEGIMSEALVAAADYHGIEPARVAALGGCNERKRQGSDACVLVAELFPAGWEERDLQLSAGATRGFRKEYRGFGAKALAISESTGKWAVAKGKGAETDVIAQCKALSSADDCVIVVQD